MRRDERAAGPLTYIYESERSIHQRMREFNSRARTLEAGGTTDENGRPYPDPAKQARWFRTQIDLMEQELDAIADA